MPLNYDSLPAQLLALLQAGRQITVRWDCGSDDHIVTTYLDGVEQGFDWDEDYYLWRFAPQEEYEQYLSRLTNLPLLLSLGQAPRPAISRRISYAGRWRNFLGWWEYYA